jgi:hypothetical protein
MQFVFHDYGQIVVEAAHFSQILDNGFRMCESCGIVRQHGTVGVIYFGRGPSGDEEISGHAKFPFGRARKQRDLSGGILPAGGLVSHNGLYEHAPELISFWQLALRELMKGFRWHCERTIRRPEALDFREF